MSLLEEIKNDFSCWQCTHIAPKSYYDNEYLYVNAANTDYSTMVCFTIEKSNIPPRAIKAWQKWKALYSDGTILDEQQMRIRLMLASRIEAIKKPPKTLDDSEGSGN